MPIKLQITTPERIVYQDEVDSISLPTPLGEITVLLNHIPLVSTLTPGAITIRKKQYESYIACSGGFIQVKPQSEVIVLADTAERAEEIDEKRAEEARERARKLLTEKRQEEDVDFAGVLVKLERELARLRVARRHRAKKTPPGF